MIMPKDIYVLLADGDGTMHSQPEPFGVAVDTEDEAKRFVRMGKVGYSHSYAKVRVFSTFKEGVDWKYPPKKK